MELGNNFFYVRKSLYDYVCVELGNKFIFLNIISKHE